MTSSNSIDKKFFILLERISRTSLLLIKVSSVAQPPGHHICKRVKWALRLWGLSCQVLSNKQKFHITQASGGSGSAGGQPEMPVTAGALGHIGTCWNNKPALRYCSWFRRRLEGWACADICSLENHAPLTAKTCCNDLFLLLKEMYFSFWILYSFGLWTLSPCSNDSLEVSVRMWMHFDRAVRGYSLGPAACISWAILWTSPFTGIDAHSLCLPPSLPKWERGNFTSTN